jgi:hypothetical protein
MTRSVPRGRAIAAFLASFAILLAACGGAGSSTPTPTPTPTPAPSPTPTFDVAAAFRSIITDPNFSGTMTLDGSISMGFNGTMTGEFSGDKSSSHALVTVDVAGTHQETETIATGGRYFSRTGAGPWIESPAPSADKPSIDTWLKGLTGLTDLGVATKNGRQLHHLSVAGGEPLGPEVFGMDPAVIRNATAAIDFYAEDDGTPAIMSLVMDWTQALLGSDVNANITADFTFSDVGKALSIRPPVDVWTTHTSDLGYSMAYPSTWTVKTETAGDGYLDSDGVLWFEVVPYTAGKGLSAEGFRDAFIANYVQDLGQPRDTPTQTKLGGEPAWTVVFQWDSNQGPQVSVDVVAVHANLGWDVALYTIPSVETRDVALFAKALATFAFTK